jgi:hypothetical protein
VSTQINRRRFPRYTTNPAYTPVAVRILDGRGGEELEGHAYNISEGGVRFEVDRALEPGTRIGVRVTFPGAAGNDADRSILAVATVVWTEDADEPGPVRTAAAFEHFAGAGDRAKLTEQFATGRYRLAA